MPNENSQPESAERKKRDVEVRDLKPGDRVVVDQGLNCNSLGRETLCEYCRTGDSHQCEFYAEHGITGLPGGLAEFISVPAVNAIPIRSGLDFTEAAMAASEPPGKLSAAASTITMPS